MRACAVMLALLLAVPAHAARDFKEFLASGYATVQAAVDAASAAGGGVVLLDSLTTYNSTSATTYNPPLIIPTGVTVRGMGRESTILEYSATDTTGIQLKGSHCGIEDLSLHGADEAGTSWGVAVGDTGFTTRGHRVRNCYIRDIPGVGIHVIGFDDSAGTSTILSQYDNVIISSFSLYDVEISLGSTTQWFTNCTFVGSGTVGVYDRGAANRFRDCVFEGSVDRREFLASNSLSTVISGCYFEHAATTANQWFIQTGGTQVRGLTVDGCYFTRTAVGTPRIFRTDASGIARNVVLSGLTVRTIDRGTHYTGDDILLLNAKDDAVVINCGRTDTGHVEWNPLQIGATNKHRLLLYDETLKRNVTGYPEDWPVIYVRGE